MIIILVDIVAFSNIKNIIGLQFQIMKAIMYVPVIGDLVLCLDDSNISLISSVNVIRLFKKLQLILKYTKVLIKEIKNNIC